MSSGQPGEGLSSSAAAETGVILPGALFEDMHTGLMRILGLEQTFATIRNYQQELIEGVVEVDKVQVSIEELQQTLLGSTEAAHESQLFNFLGEPGRTPTYHPRRLHTVGHAAILLGVQDKLIEREQQAWAKGPVAQEWLGESVVLRRPPSSVTRNSDDWGSQGPLYRGVEKGEPTSRYYRAGDGYGDNSGFHGKLRLVSLKQSGRVILGRGDQEETEIIEMFEEIKHPETGVVTGYVPRLSVDRESRPDRVRRTLRNAAVERLGPELPG